MKTSFLKYAFVGYVFLSTSGLFANDRLELNRVLRSVEYSEVLFDQSGELAAINELSNADALLIPFDHDFDIHLARNEMDQAIFMLNDIYLTRAEKKVRLSRSVQAISYNIKTSDSYNRRPPVERSFLITCESPKKFPMRCDLGRDPVTRVIKVQQLSRADCISGRTWGVDFSNNKLWVTKGCRATFQVYFR